MKNKNTIISLASIFFSCFVLYQQVDAAPATGSIHFSSSVHLGQVKASRSSSLRIASARLQSSRVGSSLTMNNRVQISGPITLGKNGRFNGGSLTMNNVYIDGSATIHSNVNILGSINGEANSDIGIGGMQITAGEHYNPRSSSPPSSQRNIPSSKTIGRTIGNLLELTNAWSILRNQHALSGNRLAGKQKINRYTGEEAYKNDRGYQLAELSKCSYKEKECNKTTNWESIDPSSIGVNGSLFNNDKTGFHAELFRDKNTGEYVLGFAGTDEWVKDSLHANVPQFEGLSAAQYEQAVELATNVSRHLENNKLSYTGHSLGGGLASMASMVTGRKAITFNAGSLNKQSVVKAAEKLSSTGVVSPDIKNQVLSNWENQKELVATYRVKGEELSHFQYILSPIFTIAEYAPPNIIRRKITDSINGKKQTPKFGFETMHAAGKQIDIPNPIDVAHGMPNNGMGKIKFAVHHPLKTSGAVWSNIKSSNHGIDDVILSYKLFLENNEENNEQR